MRKQNVPYKGLTCFCYTDAISTANLELMINQNAELYHTIAII